MSWDELVTTALLGTDRRPPPADLVEGLRSKAPTDAGPVAAPDPAQVVLMAAAHHRVAVRAGRRLPTCAAPASPPGRGPRWAPERAQQLLAELLVRRQPDLLNAWLCEAAGTRTSPWPRFWTPLVEQASRSKRLERPVLAAALGPAGRWFVAQNPAWGALAQQLEAALGINLDSVDGRLTTAAQLRAEPERALAGRLDWSVDLIDAVLAVLQGGQLGAGATRFAAAVGVRWPREALERIRLAAESSANLTDADSAAGRQTMAASAALVEAVSTAEQIRSAFGGPEPVRRRSADG